MARNPQPKAILQPLNSPNAIVFHNTVFVQRAVDGPIYFLASTKVTHQVPDDQDSPTLAVAGDGLPSHATNGISVDDDVVRFL